jgi:anti-sigma factor RsiW
MSGLVCQEVVELASDHIDGQLAPPVRSAVIEHLATCAGCRTYIEQMQTTVTLLSRLPGPRHDELPAVREAFRARGDG